MRNFIYKLSGALLLLGLTLFTVGCDNDNDEGQSVTEIETTRIKSITYTSAVCVSYVTGSYSERGICVATEPMPTLSSRIASSKGQAQFETELSDLVSGTTYYVRTYAVCNNNVVYGTQKQFTTVDDSTPLLEFSGTSKSSYTTATIEGYIVATGGNEIVERGLCYAATENPTTEDTHFTFDGTTGRMRADLTDLTDGQTYYGCAYAKTATETYYSEIGTFSTVEYEKPVPQITGIAEIGTTSITVEASVAVKNILPLTSMGLIYGQTNDIEKGTILEVSPLAAGDFTQKIEGLEQGETYYIWAFADNRKGRAYSDVTTLKTKSDYAQITLDQIDGILSRSATADVTITDLGVHEAAIREAGICWSTSEKPTVSDSKADAALSTLGSCEGTRMAVLTPNTTYHVRAFVTNEYGTTYSAEKTFTTRVDLYGSMLLVGINGKTAPKFNAWQIIVKDVTSASNTNVPYSVLSPAFAAIYDGFTEAVSVTSSYMNGVIYRLRPTTDGGVICQMTLYYRSSTKSLISTGWMNIELIRDENTGTFRFGQHSAWTNSTYTKLTAENKALLDYLTDYFKEHSFYFEWSTPSYEFGTSIDKTTGPVRMVPVDALDDYWSFTTKNYTGTSDTSAIANPF